MDMNLLCRLCAKEDRLCIQVFGPEGKKQCVAKKIRLCLPIIVKESDDFPKQICLNCLSNLDTSYELYSRCLEAQSVIKNLMLVSARSDGQMVKVYSTQEMLKMMNELREKMCEKRPAVRLGDTVYTIRDARDQAEVSSNDEQRAKKRKGEAGVMYPVGQQYMLMPSASMPPGMVIPSAVPNGQFAIAPMPSFPIQAVPSTVVSTAPAVVTNAPAPQATNVAKPVAATSTKDTVAVQPRPTAAVTPTTNSESEAPLQLSSIQSAIEAFQNSLQGSSASPSVTEPQEVSAQSVRANDPEQITSDPTPAVPIITKRSPRSSPTGLQQPSSQKPKRTRYMTGINQHRDDDDEYAADDPDPLEEDSEEDEEETPAVENPATETPSENRDDSDLAIEELSSDGSVSSEQANSHKCPYCNKHFPESVIFHHKKLHFRQKFFSCIMCNKNFRTEAGLETHRCEQC